MKIKMRKLDTISRYPDNPRRNGSAIAPVMASIEQFGFVQPIVIDEEGVIIIGHTREQAARGLGLTTVPTLTVHLPPEKVRALRIADNATHEFAEWDMEKLGSELAAIGDAVKMDPFFHDMAFLEPKAGTGAPVRASTERPPAKEVKFTPKTGKSLFRVVCPHCDKDFKIDRRTIPD